MTEYIHLIGSEQVATAGHAMQRAAESISQSVSSLSEALHQHEVRMEELVGRLEAAVNCRYEEKAP